MNTKITFEFSTDQSMFVRINLGNLYTIYIHITIPFKVGNVQYITYLFSYSFKSLNTDLHWKDDFLYYSLHCFNCLWFATYIDNRNSLLSCEVVYRSRTLENTFLLAFSRCLFWVHFFIMGIRKHADDIKILNLFGSSEDVRNLRQDLQQFQQYCILSALDLNISKCFIMVLILRPVK